MGTLNTAWNVAVSSLQADQIGLNVSANNTANVNTPGYTREVAVFDENVPLSLNGLSYGTGASVTDIQSQRDRVLEQSVDQQTQAEAASATRLAALENVEGVFLGHVDQHHDREWRHQLVAERVVHRRDLA